MLSCSAALAASASAFTRASSSRAAAISALVRRFFAMGSKLYAIRWFHFTKNKKEALLLSSILVVEKLKCFSSLGLSSKNFEAGHPFSHSCMSNTMVSTVLFNPHSMSRIID
jgi:hypothetical protein